MVIGAVRLVGYVRVSREDEHPENQEFAIYQWAAKSGHQIIDVVRDVGVSGAVPPWSRDGWVKVVSALESGRADGVVVYALDRVARSLWDVADVYRRFEERGWVLFSVREEWLNSIDPNIRKLIIAILGWAGEMEREFIKERTKEALARLKAEGKHVGRPSKWNAEIRAKIIEALRQGKSLRQACTELGISYRTAWEHLKNDPEYKLIVEQNKHKRKVLYLNHRTQPQG
jgi:DNA invertase Pin-like site-specific DNA recombinase